MSETLDDELINLSEGGGLVKSMLKSATEVIIDQCLSKESLNFFDRSDRFRYVCLVSYNGANLETRF